MESLLLVKGLKLNTESASWQLDRDDEGVIRWPALHNISSRYMLFISKNSNVTHKHPLKSSPAEFCVIIELDFRQRYVGEPLERDIVTIPAGVTLTEMFCNNYCSVLWFS